MRRLMLAAALTLLCAAFAPAAFSASADAGKPASLTLHDTHGTKVRLSDLRGKVVVLNFWATWCGPCNVEMPMLVEASKKYADKPVVFIGASVDEPSTQGRIPDFLKKFGVAYPIWLGATDVDMKKLDLGNIVPATAFLDADGVIRARILGQMRPGEIEQRVDWLLRNREGEAPQALTKHLEGK